VGRRDAHQHPLVAQRALSGGQLVEQTTHIFDLARYLVGEIVEVFTYSHHNPALLHHPDGDIAVADVVCLKFENGAVGVITNTNGLHAPGEVGLKVYTPERIVEVSWGRMVETEANRKEEYHSRDNPYLRESEAFLDGNPHGRPQPDSLRLQRRRAHAGSDLSGG
jgi:myo-inositol 2-dehydrogenase/D-chiro-inositol 1-dehydrogenase